MTRKHFTAIANILAANHASLTICKQLASAFAEANPNFDCRKFLIACGFDPREI